MITVLIILTVIAAIMLVSVIDCALNIDVTNYELPVAGAKNTSKLVCISDLHGWEYGRKNQKLVGLIEKQEPKAIIISGDMINRHASEEQVRRMLELIHELTNIAPVYYATGNHEADYMAVNGMEWLHKVSDTGAVVLYDSVAYIDTGDSLIRIGGASGRYFDGSERDNVTLQMLEKIGEDGITSIAIIHQPENLLYHEGRCKWTADLYISGHTHGGMWGIPFVGGVVAPSQGFFPKYDKGKFIIDGKKTLIINAGLSGYNFIPRVFNHPEICVIKLIEKQNRLY